MSRALCLAVALLALSGCGAAIVPILAGVASSATIAKDVFDVDVSIHQQTPGKTPINQVVTP